MFTLLFALWLAHSRPAPPEWTTCAISKMDDFVVTIETGRREESALFLPLQDEVVDRGARQIVEPLPQGLRLWLHKSDALVKSPRWLRGIIVLSADRVYLLSVRFDTDE